MLLVLSLEFVTDLFLVFLLFLLCSGQEVGPLLLEAPLIVQPRSLTNNKGLGHRSDDIGSEKQTTEFSSEASGNSVWEGSHIINEVSIQLISLLFSSLPLVFLTSVTVFMHELTHKYTQFLNLILLLHLMIILVEIYLSVTRIFQRLD